MITYPGDSCSGPDLESSSYVVEFTCMPHKIPGNQIASWPFFQPEERVTGPFFFQILAFVQQRV